VSPFTIEVNFNGETLEVSGSAWKACRGAREHGTGLQLEPDEPAGFEIESVMFKGVEVMDIIDMDRINEVTEKELQRS